MAIAPMALLLPASNADSNVKPPSVDFHNPPDAWPRYTIFGSPGTPETTSSRPPMTAGPIQRYFRSPNDAAEAAPDSVAAMSRASSAFTFAPFQRGVAPSLWVPRSSVPPSARFDRVRDRVRGPAA